ncbi:MAG: DNA polymerase III subunit delta' [Cyanobacteria bacterium CRU_2_1]|nr:DNA polymerase III subunit delta' [Cyanobacteria bacterium RU_5_0]NJR58494.1 DNA polymerase III subunit delta' [Cyanobacteria bacterium CRU_2_1]NJR58508.1 DNA polymerase III subunit delta' [Cyanobacteria bacterium CRU_2_1]
MPPFTLLLGQPQAIELLTRAVTQNRIAPAYLFVGAPGVGRSLAARCFAELLLIPHSSFPISHHSSLRSRIEQRNHPDLLWVEPTYLHQGKRYSAAEATELGLKRKAPPEIRLDQVREIAQFLSRPPLEAERSVIVLECAESMAEPAANGLLKTLEEPGKATLILIAPSTESLLPTLVSRCQRIPFRRLDEETIAQILTQADYEEILQHPDVLALAQGSPGEAIVHWQQLQAIPPDLLSAVTQIPDSLRSSLELARKIAQTLDTEAQLWLVDYLQQHHWQRSGQSTRLQPLENARRYLLQFVQPRLVWEVTLMAMR